jgi:hypothetical protein
MSVGYIFYLVESLVVSVVHLVWLGSVGSWLINFLCKKKVKQSRYTLWRRLRGEEV